MVMPGISGTELVTVLRAQWTNIGVVMMSGYSGDSCWNAEADSAGEVGYIMGKAPSQ